VIDALVCTYLAADDADAQSGNPYMQGAFGIIDYDWFVLTRQLATAHESEFADTHVNLGRNFSSSCSWVRDRSQLEIVNLPEPRSVSDIALHLKSAQAIASQNIKIFLVSKRILISYLNSLV
jgi:hypothetical protein